MPGIRHPAGRGPGHPGAQLQFGLIIPLALAAGGYPRRRHDAWPPHRLSLPPTDKSVDLTRVKKPTLAVLDITPLFARVIVDWMLIPLGVPVMIVTFILLLRRSTLNFAQPIAFLQQISSKIV